MAFFDSISKKVTQAGAEAVKKTKEVAEATKLSLAIDSEKRQLDDLYKELGQKYYETCGGAPAEELAEIVGRIKAQCDKIAGLEDQLRILRGQDKCPHCGKIIATGAKFCPNCGGKIEQAAPAAPPPPSSPPRSARARAAASRLRKTPPSVHPAEQKSSKFVAKSRRRQVCPCLRLFSCAA